MCARVCVCVPKQIARNAFEEVKYDRRVDEICAPRNRSDYVQNIENVQIVVAKHLKVISETCGTLLKLSPQTDAFKVAISRSVAFVLFIIFDSILIIVIRGAVFSAAVVVVDDVFT